MDREAWREIVCTFRQLPNGWFLPNWPQYVNPCPLETYRRGFSKMFRLGVICSQNLKIKGDQTGTLL